MKIKLLKNTRGDGRALFDGAVEDVTEDTGKVLLAKGFAEPAEDAAPVVVEDDTPPKAPPKGASTGEGKGKGKGKGGK